MSSRFFIAAALVALTGCQKREPEKTVKAAEAPAVVARVIRVEPRAFALTIPVTGTLVSRAQVDVKAETTGRVERFPKEEGDRVTAGETVVWVDRENYRLAIRQAESAVQVADAALERTRVMDAHNRSELERARSLLSSGGITEKDLKAAEVAERDGRAQVSLAAAQAEQARAALAVAQKRLVDSEVKAPVAGEIQKKYVNPGAYVEPPTPVFSLVDNNRLELESPVPTADLAPIRAGQPVSFSVNSYAGEKFRGRVIEVNPAVEAETRSARIRVHVDNNNGKLKAGMFAEGEIQTGVAQQAILVPASAVYREDRLASDSSVFLIEAGKAVRRTVQIGREHDGTLEIISGLRAGDVVVAEQSIELAEGTRVEARGQAQ